MECSCVYFDQSDGGDLAAFNDVSMPKARKVHTCHECGREIMIGEKYEYHKGFWDENKPEVYKTCADCLSVRDEFFCSGWSFGDVWSDLAEHLWECRDTDIPWSALSRLTVTARDKACDIIERGWEA